MNIFNVNLGGIRNTLASFSFVNISFNSGSAGKQLNRIDNSDDLPPVSKRIYKDAKTVLIGSDKRLVETIADDVIVYLFVGKEKQIGSAWNTIVPVIMEKSTQRSYQYGRGYFALEGLGGGLSNTTSLLNYLGLHKIKGFSVHILPFVVDESYLDDFEYADSGIDLAKLKAEAIELSLYRKNEFIYIDNNLKNLMLKYGL